MSSYDCVAAVARVPEWAVAIDTPNATGMYSSRNA